MTAHTARRFVSLRSLALAGTALTALAVASPATAAPGSGTTVVNSAADLTNPLDFDGGTLQFNVMLTTANNATFTAAGGTINTNGSNVVMSGVFSGAGGLTKTGTGQLFLSGANTYAGGTTVSGGELAGDTTSLQGNITNNATVGFFQNTNGTYAGNMSGSGSLTKTGSGTLTLSGNNTFSGGIVFADAAFGGGGIAVSAAGNLGTGVLNFSQDGMLHINGNLSAGNNAQLNFTTATIDVTGANTATLNGAFSGFGSIAKTGTGTLVLTGMNTYNGQTRMNEGVLSVSADANLGSAGSTLIFNGGILQVTGSFATIRNVTANSTVGGIEIATGQTVTLNGNVDGSGALTKLGMGTLVLNGNNTQNGLTIGGGTVVVSSDAEIGAGDIVFDGGILRADMTFLTDNNATLLAGGGTIDTNGNDITMSGDISGAGALTKTGIGTLILTGTSTYSGGTTVAFGILQGNAVSIQGNIVNNDRVRFVQTGAGTYAGDMSGSGMLFKTGGGTLTLTGTNSYTGGTDVAGGILVGDTDSLQGDIANNAAVHFSQNFDGTYAGVMSGAGTMTKLGTGTVVLSGSNSFSGGMTVQAGAVAASSEANLGLGAITLDGGALRSDASFSTFRNFALLGSGGTIDTNGNTLTLNGSLNGSGALTKSGAGELVLSGVNTFTGGTSVTGGTLFVSGSIVGVTGNVTTAAGTLLTGDGTVGGTVSGSGTLLSSAINPLTVGSYNANGGTLRAVISGAGPSLLINDAATLTGGALFVETVAVDMTLAAGQTFTILTVGDSISGDFGSIADSSAMFDFTGMVMGTNYIVTAIGAATMTDLGETENQMEVAKTLDDLGMPADPDLADVVNEIGLQDEAGVLAALDALAGEINADMPTAPIANAQLFQGSIFQRLGTLGGGADGESAFSLGQLALDEAGATPEISVAAAMAGAAGPAASGVWVRAHGLFGQVDGHNDPGDPGSHDLDHATAGVMAGYDWALSEETIVGLGAGYAHSNLDLDEVDQEGEIHSFRLAAYGGTRSGALSLRGLVGYAYHDNSTERHIVIGGFDRTADGDYAGHELSAAGEVGYFMSLGGIGLEPVAGLAVTHLSDESYEESGAGGAGLEVDGRSTTSLRSTLGARATLAPSPAFHLSASLAWAHELADTDRVVDATFLGGGGAFQIQGAEVSRDSALVGLGVGVALGEGIDLTVGYDGQFGTDDTAHGAEAVLKIGL